MRIYEIKARNLNHVAYPVGLLITSESRSGSSIGILYPKEHEILVDYIEKPVRLISTKMKEILCACEKMIDVKPAFLHHPKEDISWDYWTFRVQSQFVLHEKTKYDSFGRIEKPILDRSMVKHYNIFSVIGLLEERVFISLPILEALVRYDITGFHAEEIELN